MFDLFSVFGEGIVHTGHGILVAVRARFTGAGSHHLPCGSQISHLGCQTRVWASFLHASNFPYQSPHDSTDCECIRHPHGRIPRLFLGYMGQPEPSLCLPSPTQASGCLVSTGQNGKGELIAQSHLSRKIQSQNLRLHLGLQALALGILKTGWAGSAIARVVLKL